MDKLKLLMEWVDETEPTLHDISMELEGEYSDLDLTLDAFLDCYGRTYPMSDHNYW